MNRRGGGGLVKDSSSFARSDPFLICAGEGEEKESGNFAKRKEKVNISWGGLKRFSSRPAPLISIHGAERMDSRGREGGRELQCHRAESPLPWDRLAIRDLAYPFFSNGWGLLLETGLNRRECES